METAAEKYIRLMKEKQAQILNQSQETVAKEEAKKKEEEERRVRREMAQSFLSEKILYTSGFDARYSILQGNYWLVTSAEQQAKAELANAGRRFPVLRVEFDASSKKFHEVLSGVRGTWPCKFVEADISVTGIMAGFGNEVYKLHVPTNGVVYPVKNQARPLNAEGESIGTFIDHRCSEGFSVAEFLWNKINRILPEVRTDTPILVCPVSDSGGSTLCSHTFLNHMLCSHPLGSMLILWSLRCRVHMSAIIARCTAEFFLMSVGIHPRLWEKRVHLMVLTVQVRRGEVAAAITNTLNEYLRISPSQVERDMELDATLEALSMKSDARAVVTKASHKGDYTFVEQENHAPYKKAIHSMVAGWSPPSWSRWLSFGVSLRLFLVAVLFKIMRLCGRIFGSQIKLRDMQVPNHFAGDEKTVKEFRVLVMTGYFVSLLCKVMDRHCCLEMKAKHVAPMTRHEALQQFETWFGELLEQLKNHKQVCGDLEKLVGNLSEEGQREVRRLRHKAIIAAHAMRVNFLFRFGPFRDIHEYWIESYVRGDETVDTLLGLRWNDAGRSGDYGVLCLQSIQQHIQSIPQKQKQKQRLDEVADRVCRAERLSQGVERRIGRVKQSSKQNKSRRNYPNSNALTNQWDWIDRRLVPVRDEMHEQLRNTIAQKRYKSERAIDVARSSKMQQRNQVFVKSKPISAGVNQWEDADEKHQFKMRLARKARENEMAADAREESAEVAIDIDSERSENDENDSRRSKEVVAIEKRYYNAVESRVVSGFLQGGPAMWFEDRAALDCRRWLQPLNWTPFDVTASGRIVSPAEKAVSAFGKALNEKSKQAEKEGDLIDEGVDNNVGANYEVKEREDEHDDIADDEIAVCRRACILSLTLPSEVATSLEQTDPAQARHAGVWLVLRTDLQNQDFSASRLLQVGGNVMAAGERKEKWTLGSEALHSTHCRLLLNPHVEFQMHQVMMGDGEANEVLLTKGGEIAIKEQQQQPKKQKNKLSGSDGSYAETNAHRFVRLMNQQKQREKAAAKPDPGGAIRKAKPKEQLFKNAAHPNSVLDAHAVADAGRSKHKDDVEGAEPEPKRAKKKADFELTADLKVQQREARLAIDRLVDEKYQIGGLEIRDASSQTTYKMHGVFTDRVVVSMENVMGVSFLRLLGCNFDLDSKASKNAVRYWKHDETISIAQSLSLASVWAIRARFIVMRSNDFLVKENPTPSSDLAEIKADWEACLELLPQYVTEATMGGAAKKAEEKLRRISDDTLKWLTPRSKLPMPVRDSIRDLEVRDFVSIS